MNKVCTNTIQIIGEMKDPLVASHMVAGEIIYHGTIAVKRLSKNIDVLPITVPGRMYDGSDRIYNRMIKVTGQIRTYDRYNKGKGCLVMTVFAQNIEYAETCEGLNDVTISGTLCRKPVYRFTPFGREISELMVAVNNGAKSYYIPCVAWGANARMASVLDVGAFITLGGRFQSREYQKAVDGTLVDKITYELSVNSADFGSIDPAVDPGKVPVPVWPPVRKKNASAV